MQLQGAMTHIIKKYTQNTITAEQKNALNF